MKVAVFSTNLSFFSPIEARLQVRGHEVQFWQDSTGFAHGYKVGRLMDWCDVAFVEFAQAPLPDILAIKANHPDVVLVVRMHRIEVYSELVKNPGVNWGLVDILFVSAGHVADRFVVYRENASKPRQIIVSPTNIVNPEDFPFHERSWNPPYRIAMIGNFVPKKRQYTAIQMLADIRATMPYFHLDIVGRTGQWSGYGNIEYFQNCLDLIAELELKDNVTIYDHIAHKDLPKFLAREHAILSNSNEEGTHVSVAEAMMTGCIPMVGPWRGAKEVYPDAWHFRGTVDLIARCAQIQKMAAEGEIEALSREIAEKARARYGKIEVYDRMVEILEKSRA